MFDGELSYCIAERAEDVTFQDADERVMDALLPAVTEIRKLLHGDFGSNNLIVNGERVAAVLDRDCAVYGDPLYEVASAYFWSPWLMCMRKT